MTALRRCDRTMFLSRFFYAQKTDVLHGDLKRKKSEIGFQKDSSCEVEPTMLDEFGTCVELHTLRLFRVFFRLETSDSDASGVVGSHVVTLQAWFFFLVGVEFFSGISSNMICLRTIKMLCLRTSKMLCLRTSKIWQNAWSTD